MDERAENEQGAGHELISRLRIIEGQRLDDRAEAYAALHDELARRLEAAPADPGAAARR